MPTLRRILKYTPAMVLGLLVVAWAMSLFGMTRIVLNAGRGDFGLLVEIYTGNFACAPAPPSGTSFDWIRIPFAPANAIGSAAWIQHVRWLQLPLPLVVTMWLPLAIGPFLSFRFRLWHYLAYTTLLAVELAYFLRWQD